MDNVPPVAGTRAGRACCAGRRRFLGLWLPALACALVPGGRGSAAGDIQHLAARVRATFRDPVLAGRLGRAYLAAHPGENDPGALLGLVLGTAPPPAGRRALAGLIARQRHADFVAGRLAWVGGTLLSATEARACAIAALP